MLLASLWLAFVVAMPAWAAYTAAGALLVLVYGLLLGIGSARVRISDGVLYAGPAHISVDLLGTPEPLDAEGTRRVHGVDADARAFLLTRPYLKRSVRVPVHDPADPTPYWLISTRHPDRLARALAATRTGGPNGRSDRGPDSGPQGGPPGTRQASP
jgi:hypothetical protein